MAKIEDHKYTVAEAFNQCFYVVPDYQREYVWTEKEVDQLLGDINEEISASSNNEYFIGTILVSPTSENNHYEVIDGQQRLTTFFLILCALKTMFKNEPQEPMVNGLISTSYVDANGDIQTSFKLELRYENAGEVIDKIIGTNADPDKTRNAIQSAGIKSFGSLENLVTAYSAIYHYLIENYSDKTVLKKYLGFLATKVVFIQISTSVSSALKIFETINERGIGLNPMDLLKNLLFTNVKTDEFTKLKDEWKKITKPLEEQKEKPLRFLRYFLMANYKIENDRKDSTVREDEIYDWFINKKNAELCDYSNKPFEFVRKIIRNVENFVAFSSGKGNDGKDNLWMDNLKRMCGAAFSLHYVLLLAAASLSKPLFDHFVKQLECFLFYYIYTKTPTKELERNFSMWADELRAISSITDTKEQKLKLNVFLKEHFVNNMVVKDGQLSDALKRYTLYSMQKYRTRYLLAKITQYVDMAYKGLKIPGSLQEYTQLEIEHILPNTPDSSLRIDFTQKNPGIDYDLYKNRLGNLTLLEKPLNIVAGNDFFIKKCDEYKKCKYYLTSSMAEITTVGNNSSTNRINVELLAFTEWSAASIEQRQDMLIKIASNIWKVEKIEVE